MYFEKGILDHFDHIYSDATIWHYRCTDNHLFATTLGWAISPNDAVSLWLLFSFTITFIIILFLLRKEMIQPMRGENALPPRESIYWGIAGIFLAFFAQRAAANIEYLLGIEIRSENTEQIVGL